MVKKEAENKQEVGQQKLKLFPLITGGVSLFLMLLMCVLPHGFGDIINVFLVPAIAISFTLLGIYLIRNLRKRLNLIGIVAIVFGVISYPIMVRSLNVSLGLFRSLLMQFVPFAEGTICVWELLNFVMDGFIVDANITLVYNAAMSTTIYAGVLLYLFFPASKILKDKQEIADKNGALRFYVCMFSAITSVLVLLGLIIWGVFALISKMLGGSESSSSSASVPVEAEGVEQQVFVDGVGAVCYEVRERGEVYNVRTSNQMIGYFRDNRILDEKLKEIGFIGPNNSVCFYDNNKKGKFGEFETVYLKNTKKK